MKERLISFALLIGGLLLIANLSSSIRFFLKRDDLFLEKEKKIAELKKEHQQLSAELKKVKSKEFIEKEAREKLNMGKPGEVIVILPKLQEHKDLKTQEQEEMPNWQKWYNLFFY